MTSPVASRDLRVAHDQIPPYIYIYNHLVPMYSLAQFTAISDDLTSNRQLTSSSTCKVEP